jgi:phosphatidylglycerol lysyltransferase
MGNRIKSKFISLAPSFIGLAFFVFIAFLLQHELRNFHYREIAGTFRDKPLSAVLLAFLFLALNYAVLCVYEIIGFQYIGRPLAKRKISFTACISYAFSNAVGFYTVSSSAVRFRLYSQWGLSTIEISRLIAFNGIAAFWLGLCTISALVFLVQPLPLPQAVHLPFASTRIIGVFLAMVLMAALAGAIFRKNPLKIGSWSFEMPRPGLVLALIATACFDWVLCAAVLFVLLPPGSAPFLVVLAAFLLAQIAGLISHVPGGLGVFETAMLLLLPSIPRTEAIGSLLAFRAIYYLVPFVFSAAALGLLEAGKHARKIAVAAQFFGTTWSAIAPSVLSTITFIGGIVLLFSGASPGRHSRLLVLMKFLPLPILEISHFMGSVVGVLLLILSWGLLRRLDGAYHLALYMLCGGVAFSLLKGLDFEEATIMLIIAGLILPCKNVFYRKTSFVNDRFTPGWTVAIGFVFIATTWLGFFSFKHVPFSHDLWWQFGFFEHAPRFLRATVGFSVAVCAFAFYKLFAPSRRHATMHAQVDFDVVRSIVNEDGRSSSWLALLGDKRFLLSESKDAFIMFAVKGRTWAAMGDPVGAAASFSDLIWEFREESDRHNGRSVFYEIGSRYLPRYLDIGMTLLKIGEEAHVNCRTFSLDGGSKKSLRRLTRNLEEEGVTFEIVAAENISNLLPELQTISDQWLSRKNAKEKGFSLGFFDERYLRQTPIAVVRSRGRIVAFANLWLTKAKIDFSIDLMRFSTDAPAGAMDFLFVHLLLWGNAQGYEWFNLGMAPFSGLESRAVAPLWNRFGAFLFKHGEYFYNFQGLRQYKEKFDPVWESKYLAAPGGFSLPLVLRDISAIVSGGTKGVLTK